jgi:hypothetical protein
MSVITYSLNTKKGGFRDETFNSLSNYGLFSSRYYQGGFGHPPFRHFKSRVAMRPRHAESTIRV